MNRKVSPEHTGALGETLPGCRIPEGLPDKKAWGSGCGLLCSECHDLLSVHSSGECIFIFDSLEIS